MTRSLVTVSITSVSPLESCDVSRAACRRASEDAALTGDKGDADAYAEQDWGAAPTQSGTLAQR